MGLGRRILQMTRPSVTREHPVTARPTDLAPHPSRIVRLTLTACGVAACLALYLAPRRAASASLTLVNGEGLYECANGYPDVPQAYDREWGDLSGDWYVVMMNPRDEAAEFRCDRMVFRMEQDDRLLRQSMLYTLYSTNFWWNTTESEYKNRTGVWHNTAADTNGDFWSSVFAVGTTASGSRWAGWYFCGPAQAATKGGISYILKDSLDGLTDEFYDTAAEAASAAGVLASGVLAEVPIDESCDYTFPTAGV